MILEIAVADAYGAAYEFSKKPPPNDLKFHLNKGRKDDIGLGEYTDDTQMSIAIMRHMLSGKPLNQHWISWFFLNEFKKNPIDGYARKFQEFLENCKSVNNFTSGIMPQSKRNGSVMRSVPVGVLSTVEEVINYSYLQSSVTHATQEACLGATAVALASHYYYHRLDDPKLVASYLKRTIGFSLQKVDKSVACDALETAHAAIWIAKNSKDCKTAMKKSVDLGGDTDSVAAVSAGLISMRQIGGLYDMITKLSFRGRRSVDFLINLEFELFKKYPPINP